MKRRALAVFLLLAMAALACNLSVAPQSESLLPAPVSQSQPTNTSAWRVVTPTPTLPPEIASLTPQPTVTLMPTSTAFATVSPTPVGAGHFTMVLMGIDNRAADPSWMTDTIMLFDIDPQARTASLLSIPRDLWFWTGIAEEPLRQVNRFYALAELDERGAGGRAVKKMLQANLGVPVSAYAVIDFQVFVRLINAIGGVEIELSQPIDDPRYPDMNLGYEPFYLPAGRVHLDGETALKFARTRNIDSDYGRIGRQQRLLMAIRDKLMQPDVWPQFVARVPSLWTEVRARVDTDLTIEQVTQLALFVRAVEPDDIALDTLAATDEGYVQRHTLDDGRRVWAVMPELASDYVRALFRME